MYALVVETVKHVHLSYATKGYLLTPDLLIVGPSEPVQCSHGSKGLDRPGGLSPGTIPRRTEQDHFEGSDYTLLPRLAHHPFVIYL